MAVVGVEVQEIEFRRLLDDLVQRDDVIRKRILTLRVQTKGGGARRDQGGRGQRITASEESYIVTEIDKLLGEMGNDAFCTSIQSGWHAFIKWSDLSDTQDGVP